MGLFLGVSGAIGADSPAVLEALAKFAEAKGMRFEPEAEGPLGEPGIGAIASNEGNTSVLCPEDFDDCDKVSEFISKELGKPVFSLHIHDGDFWMYTLYHNGKAVDEFNPVPEYFDEVSPEEKEQCKGDAAVIASTVPGVQAEAVAKYLVEWDLEDETEAMAYPGDEFSTGDCWQMVDFMKRVGLPYPGDDQGKPQGTPFLLQSARRAHSAAKAQTAGKPWWKFW